jgi:hypothetical protein
LLWRRARKFLALPWASRACLLEALLALMAARLAMALLPFRRIAAWLGHTGAESPAEVSPTSTDTATRVGWAVRAIAPWVPWDSRCLAQALAATWMLRRRGIPTTLYLGVRKEPGKDFSAHAWLRCGAGIITGAPGHRTFEVIACFAHVPANDPPNVPSQTGSPT